MFSGLTRLIRGGRSFCRRVAGWANRRQNIRQKRHPRAIKICVPNNPRLKHTTNDRRELGVTKLHYRSARKLLCYREILSAVPGRKQRQTIVPINIDRRELRRAGKSSDSKLVDRQSATADDGVYRQTHSVTYTYSPLHKGEPPKDLQKRRGHPSDWQRIPGKYGISGHAKFATNGRIALD